MKYIGIRLSEQSIKKAIKQIDAYKKEIENKTELFVKALTNHGYAMAIEYASLANHGMAELVTFRKVTGKDEDGAFGYVIGQGKPFVSEWVDSDGGRHIDTINPLAMIEFGSAVYALPKQASFGGYGGQGTLATRGNENKASWYFYTDVDENGNPINRKLGTAITPTQPMFHAIMEMQAEIENIAREIFES